MAKKQKILIVLLLPLFLLKGWLPAPAAEPGLPEVNWSHPGGFHPDTLQVELFGLPGCRILYTTDGSMPDHQNGRLYSGPVPVCRTTTIRAVVIRGREKSRVRARTFLIREPPSRFPTAALAIDPNLLFHPEHGLFVQGPDAIDSVYPMPGANFWSRAEVPAQLELFEPDGREVFNSPVGFRVFGGISRLFPQKSFSVVARNRYGDNRIRHRVFGQTGQKDFKFLVFRNGGSDAEKTHFRDALLTSLVDGWDLEKQDARPCQVYINGQYWGIYNIREKVNRYFLEDHSGVDKDSIDLMEHRALVKLGSDSTYRALIRFLETHELATDSNFERVGEWMDIWNFTDYQIAQIYFDNRDAGGNIKFWRPREKTGKWRWVLYDTDWGFGLHDATAWKHNSLAFHTATDGPDWPNPPWSTFILRKLLENEGYRKLFITRFADHLNSSFKKTTVLDSISAFHDRYYPEMPRHWRRWNLDSLIWKEHIDRVYAFGREREDQMRLFLMDRFRTGRKVALKLEASPGGKILLNDHLLIEGDPFEGTYFGQIPVHLAAVPHFGYRFSHWEGLPGKAEHRLFDLHLREKAYFLRAIFRKFEDPLMGKVVINEVSCNNKASGDWVEIYNDSKEAVDLGGWIFTDSDHAFTFPPVILPPKDYLVLCNDSIQLMKAFPKAYNLLGRMEFGLNKRQEVLGLFSRNGALIDSFSYELPPTDSVFTLNLLLPWLDNSDPENWEVKWGAGSPASANPYYVQSRIRKRQSTFGQLGLATGVILLCLVLLWYRRQAVGTS